MVHWCVRGGAATGRAIWLAAALCLMPFVAPAQAGEAIPVELDQARLIKLPERATTVVIGDPLIADLSLQPGGLAVITGKGFGATNVIVLDKDGAVLAEHTVLVRGPTDPIVVVYRGITRETYSCAPECQPRITLGDNDDYFSKVLNQSTTRNNQAMAAGALPNASSGGGSAVNASGSGGGGVTITVQGGGAAVNPAH
jgi:Flp pilus assembly secretin CpaC